LEGEIQVDQCENSPTILLSGSGWAPANEGAISSKDKVAWNFKVPRVGEISLLKNHQVIPIGVKKRTEFGTIG